MTHGTSPPSPDPDPASGPTVRSPVPGNPWVQALAPAVVLALFLGSAFLVFGSRAPEFLGWVVAYVVPPMGKESVIPALLARGFPAGLVLVYILGLDILGGLFVAWNYDRLLGLPKVGPWLEDVQAHWTRKHRARPWLGNLTFTGIVLYVAVPLQGSGGVAGALLGRTLGMPPYRVLLAVTAGAALAVVVVVNLSSLVLAALAVGWGWAVMMLVGAGMVTWSLLQHARRWSQGSAAG